MTFAGRAKRFYRGIAFSGRLPRGVRVINPCREPTIRWRVEQFLDKYYANARPRVLVLGINPGRFGAGLTGVAFTDPVALQESCDISNGLPKKRELFSEFVYQFIEQWGGARQFYRLFFLTAVCPLGFLKGGKNYNYCDNA